MLSADFWQDKNNSQRVIKEKKFYEDLTNSLNNNVEKLKDLDDLNQLAFEEENLQVQKEVLQNIKDLRSEVKKNEIKCFLSNEADPLNCYIEIHAGAGGTESQDWAEMLRRMYIKWSNNKNYKLHIISEHKGDEAGIKSSTIKIDGDYVFGLLKSESGIHRLVRISPFDSGARRHTSFASVWVYPVVDDDVNIEIKEKELRVDTYRSSGAGGQHVNTTDSAVRITHNPTGIVVTSSEKSQHQNRDIAMKALKSRLYQLELDKRNAAISDAHESKGDAGWGNQIRSYVLHPYQMVKDLRSNIETSDTQGVLNGKLDDFMASALALNVVGKSRAEANSKD